jgi:hypothetical protein
MMIIHAQAGHATTRHSPSSPRLRGRSAALQFSKKLNPARQLGDKIVAFALRAEGSQVGAGECFDLADQALANAGARTAAFYTDVTPDGDYIWGTPVRPEAARPGDILQFRNFRIVRRITTTIRNEDGEINQVQTQEVEERDHHTAIVTQNLGTSLAIAEQNVEPLGRIVQRNTIEIASGTTTAFNAQAAATTRQVSLDGELRAYRPQRDTAPSLAVASARPGS